jgi:hypothetical protein
MGAAGTLTHEAIPVCVVVADNFLFERSNGIAQDAEAALSGPLGATYS